MELFKREGDSFIKLTEEEVAAAAVGAAEPTDTEAARAAEYEAFQADFTKSVFAIAEKRGITTFAAMKQAVREDRKLGERFMANIFQKE